MKIQYTEFKAGKETIKRSNCETVKRVRDSLRVQKLLRLHKILEKGDGR